MRNLSRTGVTVAVAGVFIAGFLSIRSGAAPQTAPSSSDALLSEIRALRADLNHRLDASIRAQLLVARLQLQEQRITTLSRQMSDVQQQLSQTEAARAAIEPQLKMFETSSAAAPQEKKEADFFLQTLRTQVETMTKGEEELKRQQLYLSGLLADEQARWSAFNVRLEELERLLTPSAPPRDR